MKSKKQERIDGRTFNEVRPLHVQYDTIGYSSGSVLLEIGRTVVLVSITLQSNVPRFLKGKGTGWLTAEYAMLPTATHQRTTRESKQNQPNPRNTEISRLIGRCLRTTVDLKSLGEKTITIDCDVLQADGGTRTACITAASIALARAAQRWEAKKITSTNIFHTPIAAISAGIIKGQPHLDLAYSEDSQADADFNFVITKNGDLIEIQGTAEKVAISWNHFDNLKEFACKGVNDIFSFLAEQPIPPLNQTKTQYPSLSLNNKQIQQDNKHNNAKSQKLGLFSLANRLNTPSE